MRKRQRNGLKTVCRLMPLSALLICVTACNLKEEIEELVITISGNVSHEGESVSGALMLLVESTDVSDGLNLANASLTTTTGDYVILDVDPGEYFILAVDDANDSFEFDADSDRLGFYGINPSTSDFQPDAITVSDEDVSGVDIVYLYTLP